MEARTEAGTDGLRRFPRIPFQGDVYIMDGDGYGFVLEATDLSRGGVFVKTPLLLSEGDPCALRFEVEAGRAVQATGVVSRAQAESVTAHPNGFAIAFEQLDDESRQNLWGVTKPRRQLASA